MKTASCIGLLISVIISFSQAQDKSSVLATVGSTQITAADFNAQFEDVKKRSLNPPTRAQFLEELIRFELGVQEAQKMKLDQDPIVKRQMTQAMYAALLEKKLTDDISKITVSDKEMQEFYKNNPEFRLSHIRIDLRSDATPEQKTESKKRGQEIFDEVKKSKRPFEELVRLYSDDPISKAVGGDLGWQTKLTISPNIYEQMTSMKVNEIKGLFETPFGFHIIKLTGKRTFETANKRAIRTAVYDEKRKQIMDRYFEGLKKSYKVKINN